MQVFNNRSTLRSRQFAEPPQATAATEDGRKQKLKVEKLKAEISPSRFHHFRISEFQNFSKA